MNFTNNAMLIRRELITRIGKQILDETLLQNIDRIPLEMRPKGQSSSRCCIYKDRAVLKYKIMALLGFNYTDETDELTPLSHYALMASQRTQVSETVLTVVDEACSACVKVNYEVTNLCRGCVGRPCMLNCPKDAISVINHKALIDHDKCINCGKCQKACPYHAIIYQPIPCEEACPVGAITKNELGIEVIDDAKCIHCGKCLTACPFGAIIENSQIIEIFSAIKQGKQVIALPAPSIIGQFKWSYDKILGAIKALGFTDIYEVAKGANETTAHETAELIEKIQHGQPFMTTSCCPAYVETVNKHIPDLKPFVSDTLSPMQYAAKAVKEAHPNAITVFIGPCIAKRKEAMASEFVDYTLSFEELGSMFIAKGVFVYDAPPANPDSSILKHGHGFASAGGVIKSVLESVEANPNFTTALIDGIEKPVIAQLKTFPKGKHPANFIEVMSCQGGCLAGPLVLSNPRIALNQLNEYIKA
jgi:[FeFe] hydrogenase (group B1/B3)